MWKTLRTPEFAGFLASTAGWSKFEQCPKKLGHGFSLPQTYTSQSAEVWKYRGVPQNWFCFFCVGGGVVK